jgi:hypothetical protein
MAKPTTAELALSSHLTLENILLATCVPLLSLIMGGVLHRASCDNPTAVR